MDGNPTWNTHEWGLNTEQPADRKILLREGEAVGGRRWLGPGTLDLQAERGHLRRCGPHVPLNEPPGGGPRTDPG